jgi:hypothetical protein
VHINTGISPFQKPFQPVKTIREILVCKRIYHNSSVTQQNPAANLCFFFLILGKTAFFVKPEQIITFAICQTHYFRGILLSVSLHKLDEEQLPQVAKELRDLHY